MSSGSLALLKQKISLRSAPTTTPNVIDPCAGRLVLCAFQLMAQPAISQVLDTAQSATAPSRFRDLTASLSGSYTTSRDFHAHAFRNVAFATSGFYQDDLVGADHKHSHKLLSDVSMLKFIDSIWTKGNDRLQANLLWCANENNWTHSYSVVFATQFLPNERPVYDIESRIERIERYGGFLSPANLELSYGATWNPWPLSTIQFGFATARLLSSPKASLQPPDLEHFAQDAKTVYDLQYGGSIVVAINHPLTDRISWLNSSRMFCNAFDRDHVSLDLMNRFCIKLWKYVRLRLETRAAYDPMVSYNMKFSLEFLLGVFYDLKSP